MSNGTQPDANRLLLLAYFSLLPCFSLLPIRCSLANRFSLIAAR